MAWTPKVATASIKRDQQLPQLVRPSVKLVEENAQGAQRPLIVRSPARVWYALTGNGVTHQGALTRSGNRYWHNPVALDGNSMRLVLKVVTDNPHVPAFHDGDVAVS